MKPRRDQYEGMLIPGERREAPVTTALPKELEESKKQK